ncbi:copper homeostasis protein [Actinokineospora alba]|uniref:Copper homeostasis protein cutC homolog n=1 Tax=Actinokineospora alba TaxID=504798 RepID=A0A1H0FE46_9PSEU|nr:copper homeostasis protein CutC [Actinokineospora alba]SDI16641.1 copper homeostasis protein [Actinokineospora alba]SDN92988.1 copper homeostasis protein [Actinokineospora alba]
MTGCLLEVIALTVADARAAERGGADRVEVVSDMAADGLTPAARLVERMRSAVDLPLRVMLRDREGFTIDREGVACLARTAKDLRAAGADEFVLGFLTADGRIDVEATTALVEALGGARWTFHRAIDHAADQESAWSALHGLPGLDFVLTAGSAAGVPTGLPVLADRAARPPTGVRLLAGGGLRTEHVPALRAMGVDAIHVGGLVRSGWDSPVCEDRVRALRAHLEEQ